MTNAYKWVQWNGHKKGYDLVVIGACVAYLVVFVGVSSAVHSGDRAISPPVLLIRGLGTLAIVLLHVILAIGPMARVSGRFGALLYNRRHLGVVFFFCALGHGLLSVLIYGGFGVRDPVSAVLDSSGGSFAGVSGFPFEVLGAAALAVFFVMAATSHDFWLANLSARVWKGIHMCVYGAYWLVVGHVALGALQSETSAVYPVLLVGGAAGLIVLHGVVGVREVFRKGVDEAEGWIDACAADEMAEGEGRVVCGKGTRIALFRHGDAHYAMENVCAHQGGPLGEGAVIDGCATCPWHGYQYEVESGESPPPYEEKVGTHDVKVEGGRVLVRISANPIGGGDG